VAIDGKITVKPDDVKYPARAISDHWGFPIKPKRPKSHVICNLLWNRRLDGITGYFLAAHSVAMRADKLIPGPLCQLPEGVGQGALLLGAATLNGVVLTAVPETKCRRFSSSIDRWLRSGDALAPFLVGLLDFRRQCGF
jgi:hypothetical protein